MPVQILLIEDDADLSREIQEYLERRGYRCLACATIADAETALTHIDPDVVLSDICLPDGCGVTLCLARAPVHPRARWLLMSGNLDIVRDMQDARPDGAVTVVDKPVTLRRVGDFIAAR